MASRSVPSIPEPGYRIPLVIDTDAANEIDDLYALALAVRSPDRFDIAGIVASHFAAKAGPESIRQSYEAIEELLSAAESRQIVRLGGDPLLYPRLPSRSDGAEFIIECARAASPTNPLHVLAIGAASNLASALLIAPDIVETSVFMFHGRSEDTWPTRTTQFNIYGDILATQVLLESAVPLIWFDTGTRICATMEETEKRLAPMGKLGEFLHQYRFRNEDFKAENKGFFDLGDVAWLIEPSLCTHTVIDAPTLTRWMYFEHSGKNGKMLHVSNIDVKATWELFYERLGGASR